MFINFKAFKRTTKNTMCISLDDLKQIQKFYLLIVEGEHKPQKSNKNNMVVSNKKII